MTEGEADDENREKKRENKRREEKQTVTLDIRELAHPQHMTHRASTTASVWLWHVTQLVHLHGAVVESARFPRGGDVRPEEERTP